MSKENNAKNAKLARTLLKLYRLMRGTSHEHERKSAENKIKKLLAGNGYTWNDLQELLDLGEKLEAGAGGGAEFKIPNTFDLVYHLLERHIVTKPHYLVAISLWAMHTHVYRQFNVTPRLAVLSPIKNCGKTTVIDILKWLVWNNARISDTTVASLFHFEGKFTLLLDEGDNLEITKSMRTFLNDSYKIDGQFSRFNPKTRQTDMYPVFGPVALAGIGVFPPTVMSRSIIIHMHRNSPDEKYTRFDQTNVGQIQHLIVAKNMIAEWARKVRLNPEPDIPPMRIARDADNWRVLLSIADSLDRGDIARDAAIKIIGEYQPPEIEILLLWDIRTVFDVERARILPGKILVDKLRTLEDAEHDWGELTQAKMGHMLNMFQIRPRKNTWWPEGVHRSEQQNLKCYFRLDFEEMWERYGATKATNATSLKPKK